MTGPCGQGSQALTLLNNESAGDGLGGQKQTYNGKLKDTVHFELVCVQRTFDVSADTLVSVPLCRLNNSTGPTSYNDCIIPFVFCYKRGTCVGPRRIPSKPRCSCWLSVRPFYPVRHYENRMNHFNTQSTTARCKWNSLPACVLVSPKHEHQSRPRYYRVRTVSETEVESKSNSRTISLQLTFGRVV